MTSDADGIAAQFRRPHGFVGRLCGVLMAVFNADMERAAVRRLDVPDGARVLAIGFGPGLGLRLLARRLPHARIAGVDHSTVMAAQARRRCRRAIAEGRLDVRVGTVTALPWDAATFDGVTSVNNVHFWDPLTDGVREVARVLRPGGRLVIGVHAWAAEPPPVHGGQPVAITLPALLAERGFRDVRVESARAASGRALYYTAVRA